MAVHPALRAAPGPADPTHVQRMEILQKAYDKVDKTRVNITSWLVVVAQA